MLADKTNDKDKPTELTKKKKSIFDSSPNAN